MNTVPSILAQALTAQRWAACKQHTVAAFALIPCVALAPWISSVLCNSVMHQDAQMGGLTPVSNLKSPETLAAG